MPNRYFFVEFGKYQKAVSILPHEAKALLELFCFQPMVFGQRQNSSSSSFASWSKKNIFYIGESGLDRPDIFQKFRVLGLDQIQFYRIRTGLGLKNFRVPSSLGCGRVQSPVTEFSEQLYIGSNNNNNVQKTSIKQELDFENISLWDVDWI